MKNLILCAALGMLMLVGCAGPQLRLYDDALTVKKEFRDRYRNIYCSDARNRAAGDGSTLRGTIVGLRVRNIDDDRLRDTVVVFLPDSCPRESRFTTEIPMAHVDLPARMTNMILNREQNINRFLTYNSVTGIPELRDVPIDSCGCTDRPDVSTTTPSTPCRIAPCRPFFTEMRVVPGLFSYADQTSQTQSTVRRTLAYEVATGFRFGGVHADAFGFIKALANLDLGLESKLGCPCIRVDTVFVRDTVIRSAEAPTITVSSDSVLVQQCEVNETTRHSESVHEGVSRFVGFDPMLRLFARLDGDVDGSVKAGLGLTPSCSKWGIGMSYTSPMAVYNAYTSGVPIDIQRAVTMLHLRYDFDRVSCMKPFAYAQIGTSMDSLTLNLWKYNLSGDANVDSALAQIQRTCGTCNLGGGGGGGFNFQLPSLQAAIGGLPISYGFGIGIEYPLFNMFDIAADIGYRSLAAGEAIPYLGALQLPTYRRIGMWRLRVGITL